MYYFQLRRILCRIRIQVFPNRQSLFAAGPLDPRSQERQHRLDAFRLPYIGIQQNQAITVQGWFEVYGNRLETQQAQVEGPSNLSPRQPQIPSFQGFERAFAVIYRKSTIAIQEKMSHACYKLVLLAIQTTKGPV